ncbi:MAG: hypothetical protein EBV15_01500 [Bacteroidetes bacterium]|nr:hypothetical protein [Bacteroidota bacterium]
MMRVLLISLLLGMSLLMSCKKATDDYKSRGPEYFPMRIGAERLYYYDSVHYSRLQNNTRVFHYLIKEFVKDTFTDQSGKLAYRLEQYRSKDTGRSYEFYDLIAVSVSEYGVQRVEENRRNMVLSFPIRNLKVWYPYSYWNDSFNTYIKYQYTAVDKPFDNGYIQNPEAVFVKQQYDSTFIFVKEAREIYGKSQGLLYRIKRDLDLQDLLKPDGYELTWQLIKYYP